MERVQKLLARAGIASRRAAERLIREGRVTIDGQPARLGSKADPTRQVVAVDGRPITLPERHHYLALHKPPGYLSSRYDPQGRPTVMALVPEQWRPFVYPVGRLDADSEGLLFLFDDGALAFALMHPRFQVPKRYHVLVEGTVGEETLKCLREGVRLKEGRTAPAEVERMARAGNDTWLAITIREGRKRQIRRMLEAVGHRVRRLIRVAIDGVELGDLPPGRWRELTPGEIARLWQAVDGSPAEER